MHTSDCWVSPQDEFLARYPSVSKSAMAAIVRSTQMQSGNVRHCGLSRAKAYRYSTSSLYLLRLLNHGSMVSR